MGISNSFFKVLRKVVDGVEDIAHDTSKAYKSGKGVSGAAKKTFDSTKNKVGGAYNNTKEEFTNSEFYEKHKDNIGMKTVRFAKNTVKGTLKHTVKMENDPEAFFGKKFSPKAPLVALAFASTLVDPVETGVREYQRGKYGQIDGGYAPGTINATSSPTFDAPLAYSQSEKGLKEVFNNVNGDIARERAGVDAEIVFALHNLRNNGGNM